MNALETYLMETNGWIDTHFAHSISNMMRRRFERGDYEGVAQVLRIAHNYVPTYWRDGYLDAARTTRR